MAKRSKARNDKGRPQQRVPGMAQGLGRAITEARDAQGLTRYALARKTGIAYSGLYKIERGESEVSPSSLQRVADALGVSSTELWSRAQPPATSGTDTAMSADVATFTAPPSTVQVPHNLGTARLRASADAGVRSFADRPMVMFSSAHSVSSPEGLGEFAPPLHALEGTLDAAREGTLDAAREGTLDADHVAALGAVPSAAGPDPAAEVIATIGDLDSEDQRAVRDLVRHLHSKRK